MWLTGALACLLCVAPSPTRELTFEAAAGRLVTGVFVERGDLLDIRADGAWTMWGGHFGMSNAEGHRFRAGLFGWGRLMARVGAGQEISVGVHSRWTSADRGELVLYPNLGEYGVRDGRGALKVSVTGGRPVAQVVASLARSGVRIEVPAAATEIGTGVFVQDGDQLSVDAFGEWRMYDDGPWLSPAGDLRRLISEGIPWGRLVARFGGPTFAVGETFTVGPQREIRPRRGGLLYLGPAVGEYAGHARGGTLTVVVRGGAAATAEQAVAAQHRAEDYERTRAFLRLHEFRLAMGLPPAECDPVLMRAAQAHAVYLARHGLDGHAETAGQDGFTGVTPAERTNGFSGRVAELVHGYTDGVTAVDGLLTAVYHRLPLMDPAATRYGVGVARSARPICVVVAGAPPGEARAAGPVVCPRDRQVYVPPSWSGLEDPSPLPAGAVGPVGFPIALVSPGTPITAVEEAVVLDSRDQPVECWLLRPGSDPAKLLTDAVVLIPRRPLDPQRQYTVNLRARTAEGQITRTWRFSTGYGGRLLPGDPQLDNPANPVIDLGR